LLDIKDAILTMHQNFEEKRQLYLKNSYSTDTNFTIQVRGSSVQFQFRGNARTLVFQRMQVCQVLFPKADKTKEEKSKKLPRDAGASNCYSNFYKSLCAEDRHLVHPTEGGNVNTMWFTVWGLQQCLSYNWSRTAHAVDELQDVFQNMMLLSKFQPTARRQKPEDRYIGYLVRMLADEPCFHPQVRPSRQVPGGFSHRVLDLLVTLECKDGQIRYIDVECDERNHEGYVQGYKENRETDIALIFTPIRFYYFDPHQRNFSTDVLLQEVRSLCEQVRNLTGIEEA